MKYLKSFRIFESTSEDLLDIIKDIFISLDDQEIRYNIDDLKRIGLIHIEINGQSQEINDCIKHLENYLKDLGHEYFIGRSIENETHISIEKDFNQEIEKNFLEIIEGIIEVRDKEYPKSRIWLTTDGYCLFNQDDEEECLFYDFDKIFNFYQKKIQPTLTPNFLLSNEINEIVRYLVGKHLKLESLDPESCSSRFMQAAAIATSKF